MYLVVTNKRDLTSDFIILELQRRRLQYLRLNTEDMPKSVFRCCPGSNDSWQLDIPGGAFDLSQVKAAYFRRPGTPEPFLQMREAEQAYCTQEWHAALQFLYWDIGDRWLNSPHSIALAENKIYQLTVATKLGFKIPETLVSNDPVAVKDFSRNRQIVGKPLRNAVIKDEMGDRVLFTTRISVDNRTAAEAIRACPIILQREIKKQFDVRVTVVGNKAFAATIDSQSDPATEVDWRRMSKPNLAHDVYELPKETAARCIALTQQLGLRFGAIDFVLDQDDGLWFLEINPNGQWGWIETRTGHPISAAIVSEMELIANA